MPINGHNAGDLRRAAAFIKHHAYRNGDGMNAILQEALDVKRAGQFIQSILATYDAIVPQLVTTAGQRAMVEMILILEQDAELDVACRRACRFLVAYGEGDTEGTNAIMRETDDVSPTIVALLDVYATILPTLHTPFGIDIIDRGIRTLSGMEVAN